MFISIYKVIKIFFDKLNKHSVGAFAAQAAFFILLAIFPFVSVLLSLIKYTSMSKDYVFNSINTVIPDILQPFINTIVDELYSNRSETAVYISIILAVWSAGKGVMAIIYGLNSVYEREEKRNYLLLRLISGLYIILFLAAILISLALMVFGNSIYEMTKKPFPFIYGILTNFIEHKEILTFLVLVLFFLVVYKVVPYKNKKKYPIQSLIPGACFSAIGWVAVSYFFSIYVKMSTNFSYTYGSLISIIVSMFWLYFCMYILFIGAELNIYFNTLFTYLYRHKFKKKEE